MCYPSHRFEIITLPHGDNLVYLLRQGPSLAVVDPGSARPVMQVLESHSLRPDLILVTHHHGDHTGGIATLVRRWDCAVAGPPGGRDIDRIVTDGDSMEFAGAEIRVMSVPGHTENDLAYYLPAARSVLTGDTLFAAGCGRVVSGSRPNLWQSLCRLQSLPDATRIYGGHDYTLDNLEFAAAMYPRHSAILNRLGAVRHAISDGSAYLPSTIACEKRTNPFLLCPNVDAFTRLRSRKDMW